MQHVTSQAQYFLKEFQLLPQYSDYVLSKKFFCTRTDLDCIQQL